MREARTRDEVEQALSLRLRVFCDEQGVDRIRLHAQLAAMGLYERSGYAAEGETFLEEGIEHVTMEKRLA